MSKADELKKLKNLYDEGILTEDEYLSEKNKLLNIEETQRNEIFNFRTRRLGCQKK